MGKQFISILSRLFLSTVLSSVYHVDAAGSCSDHDKDCSQCQKFKSFNCNFVTKTDNKTVTKCLNDEDLHTWKEWNIFQVKEECNDKSNKTVEIATNTPDAINPTPPSVEQNNNDSKETNHTDLIDPPEKNVSTDDKKEKDTSDDDKKSDEPKEDDNEKDGDKSQNNKLKGAQVDPNNNVTDNSTHEDPDVTSTISHKNIAKIFTTVATVNDTKVANKTEEAASKSEDNNSFHGGSFIGGIILVICISFVIFFGIRYYKAHRDGRPFSHRLFGNGGGFAAERHDSDEPGFPF